MTVLTSIFSFGKTPPLDNKKKSSANPTKGSLGENGPKSPYFEE
jgi:hypothetical protein